MQFPEDGPDVIRKFSSSKLSLGNFGVVVYGVGMDLPAYTLSRAVVALLGRTVKTMSLYDFAFLDSPYVDQEDVVFMVSDEAEVREVVDNYHVLGVKGYLLTCLKEVKVRGDFKVTTLHGEACQMNMALSLLSWVSSTSETPRARRLREELNLSDSWDWFSDKITALRGGEYVLSPVLQPARSVIQSELGFPVKTFYDKYFSDPIVIYTGVDSMTARRLIFKLRSEGKNVRELQLNTDPLTAPIYLSIMFYILKNSSGS